MAGSLHYHMRSRYTLKRRSELEAITCGIVGQLLNFLMASLSSGSASTLRLW